jgi:pimeloyl-ACP methyl ester carboxylesterase
MPNSTPRETQIDIPGLTIAAREWGPEDGRPVLSAHGWLDNAATFDRLAARLVDELDDLRIVAFDFPGHGRSDHRPEGMTYHFIDWVPVFFDVADALGWQSFSLMCHSMGAAAASLAAGTYPERIERMVLIDGLGPWTTPGEQAAEQLEKALDERKVLATKESRTFASVEEAVATVAKVHGLSPENARLLVERGLVERGDGLDGESKWQFSYDLQLRGASHLRMTEEQVFSFFARVTCPGLLIRPTDGWPTDSEYFQRRIEAVEGLQVVEVEGGHHVHLEHPERVVGVIGGFFGE